MAKVKYTTSSSNVHYIRTTKTRVSSQGACFDIKKSVGENDVPILTIEFGCEDGKKRSFSIRGNNIKSFVGQINDVSHGM